MLTSSVSVLKRSLFGTYSAMSDAEAGERLTVAFDRATEHVCDQTMAVLNEAAVTFVDRLKKQGMTPERVIIAVKRALRSGSHRSWSWFPSLDVPSEWAPTRTESTVYARVFTWCVEAYYSETASLVGATRCRRSTLLSWTA